MKRLQGPDEPFDINIVGDIVFTCRPRDHFDFAVAEAAATRLLRRLEDSADVCVEAGLLPAGTCADLADPDQRNALYHIFLIQEMAVRVITGWRGSIEIVSDGTVSGAPDKPSPVLLRGMMSIWPKGSPLPLGEIFFRKYMAAHAEIDAAKKDSATVAGGILPPGPVAATAPIADPKVSHAPTEKPD